jgi:hypothetical protein
LQGLLQDAHRVQVVPSLSTMVAAGAGSALLPKPPRPAAARRKRRRAAAMTVRGRSR